MRQVPKTPLLPKKKYDRHRDIYSYKLEPPIISFQTDINSQGFSKRNAANLYREKVSHNPLSSMNSLSGFSNCVNPYLDILFFVASETPDLATRRLVNDT
jgi:hypothetical protein